MDATNSLGLSQDELFGEVANEFFAEVARGERPSLSDFAERYPEIADHIRRTFPALLLVGTLSGDDEPMNGALPDERKTLGDFRLIREIGRGGMGTVFEAEQLSMGRRVALKVLPFAALVNETSLQRFRNEVRAAAALNHPHIVPVYSIGEDRSIHFYAMQLIRGRTLADFIEQLRKAGQSSCRELSGKGPARLAGPTGSDAPTIDSAASLPATKRVEQGRISTVAESRRDAEDYRVAARLGIEAAEALQHAHDQGVLHRDIKPGNLLLDGDGKLYVTDFGLARIEADAGLTMTGDIVGTLRYMAPEQALAKRVVIDHRADIYSLGATLYELLTLQPAFGETDRSELLKQIAFEEPRLLRKLDRHIPAELETIVLKAMAKNPDERYHTAQHLADDLCAYLENKPIAARPPTLFVRATKWSRRHRGFVTATAIVVVMLTIGSLFSMARLLSERHRTQMAAAESKAVVDFLVNDLLASAADENRLGREVTVREVLANAEAKVTNNFGDQPLIEARLQDAIAKTYFALGKYESAEKHARRAFHLWKQFLGSTDHNSIQSLETLANVLVAQNKHDEARQFGLDAYESTRRILGPRNEDSLLADRIWIEIILKTLRKEDIADGLKLAHEAVELNRAVFGSDHRETLVALGNLAEFLRNNGDRDGALGIYRDALDVSRKVCGPEDPLTLRLSAKIAIYGRDKDALGHLVGVFQTQRRVLGLKDDQTLDTMLKAVMNSLTAGKVDEARKLCEEGVKASREKYGAKHWNTLYFMWLMAWVEADQGQFDKAVQIQQDVVKGADAFFGSGNSQTHLLKGDLAVMLKLQGKFKESLALFDDTIESRRKVVDPDDEYLKALVQLREEVREITSKPYLFHRAQAVEFAKQGKYEQARKCLDNAMECMPPEECKGRSLVAWVLAVWDAEAMRDGHRAVEIATKACDLSDYKDVGALDTLAAAYAEAGDFVSAVKWSEMTVKLTGDVKREKYTKHLESFRNGKPWRWKIQP